MPLLDVVLLAATVISVRNGAEPSVWHGLSAAYLGITVVYGHSTLRWADRKFAQRYGNEPEPTAPTLYGRQAIVAAWLSWLRFLLAYGISVGLTAGLIALAGGVREGAPLLVWLNPLTKILVYSVIWPLITTLRPGTAPAPRPDGERS
ncbi:hypothetical protein ACFVZW_30485 [Streptomyces sp. NPDC059567]|uniref:hypothetical protein n=1 Tax=Streptomyces sp. NPDC059567 TaxID=3346867 RepID=UPI0036CD1343